MYEKICGWCHQNTLQGYWINVNVRAKYESYDQSTRLETHYENMPIGKSIIKKIHQEKKCVGIGKKLWDFIWQSVYFIILPSR